MQKALLIIPFFLLIACQNEVENQLTEDTTALEIERLSLDLSEANNLIERPLRCIDTEYPNKLGQVIGSDNDLQTPEALHPAFYGCFDWHSAVHGHWSLIRLVNMHPDLTKRDEAMEGLIHHLSTENIEREIEYFSGKLNGTYERMYGWAWLLKLSEELEVSKHPRADQLSENLRPLSELIAGKVKEFLPKLNYPIRVGTHTNTAFAMTMIYDYAVTFQDMELKELVEKRARDYYLNDLNCPLSWEPSGYDFLSPCFEEADIMRRVLPKEEFKGWLAAFLPNLSDPDFQLEPGIVTDRRDGHLVHLDGLNFSRAWCLYGIVESLPEYEHLVSIANAHVEHSLPNLVGDNYEGGHWLASFALLSLSEGK